MTVQLLNKAIKRTCKACGRVKTYPTEFRPKSYQCRTCYVKQSVEQTRLRRAAETAEMRAERNAKHAARRRKGIVVPTAPTAFDVTRAQLERAWGPYASWTRAQHYAHTQAIRALIGLPPLPEVAA